MDKISKQTKCIQFWTRSRSNHPACYVHFCWRYDIDTAIVWLTFVNDIAAWYHHQQLFFVFPSPPPLLLDSNKSYIWHLRGSFVFPSKIIEKWHEHLDTDWRENASIQNAAKIVSEFRQQVVKAWVQRFLFFFSLMNECPLPSWPCKRSQHIAYSVFQLVTFQCCGQQCYNLCRYDKNEKVPAVPLALTKSH